MAYDTLLAERIRTALKRQPGITEKHMFGGVCFLLHGNMLVGLWKDSLIARLGPELGTAALSQPHVGPMDITGKPMKGWVIIAPAGLAKETDLQTWITLAIQFVKGLEPKSTEKKTRNPKSER
jgi:TfoX/Sxy family transcriptional regulator of competence genes